LSAAGRIIGIAPRIAGFEGWPGGESKNFGWY
jgi:hypothetical protein